MSDTYVVAMQDQTIVASATLAIIHTEATSGNRGSLIEILRMYVSQQGTATSQQLGVQIGTKASAFGTYTSTTPQPYIMTSGAAASAITGGTAGAESTAGTDASAEGAGTFTAYWTEGFNNLNGWLWVPTPEERIRVGPDTAIALKLLGTPTTLTNWNAGIVYREVW